MTPRQLEAARERASGAAVEAGELLRRAALDLASLRVEEKAPGDVASRADRDAEALLRARLLEVDPHIGFVGEEGGGRSDAGAPHWLVDPLDGSMNFVRGYPAWAVSIALVVDGEPVVGVVHDPCRGETISASSGGGVRLEGGSAASPRPPRSLSQAVVGTVFPKPGSPRLPQYLAEFARVVSAAGGVRRSGAMALELAWLATGRLDAFWEHDMAPWDAAAGVLLLREAGVRCVARDGQPWSGSRSLAAATPALLDDFVTLLDGATA
ncbi:MAG: inositol monophosphatase [Piscinibacter sp.]|uniref:inositol monophosphatase family protein n=1 Tax=Piscinibacter sp. TaxID=1903157 RepID=UPI003D13CFE7